MGRIARVVLLVAIVAPLVAGASGCGDVNAALKRLSDAQALSADLQIEFAKAADASNRAVMADTDALSATFAKEADEARQAVKADAAALARAPCGPRSPSTVIRQAGSALALTVL